MNRTTCLMLDMGGVLTQDQRLDKVEAMMEAVGARGPGSAGIGLEEFRRVYFAHRGDYDRGVDDAAAYWARVAGELGLPAPNGRSGELAKLDLASWFNMRPAMIGFLERLNEARRRGESPVEKLVLLSNIHVDGTRYLREGEGRSWAGLFDLLVLSCEQGLMKPERAIYEFALKAAGARAEESLFVDDYQPNVEGAIAAGLSSFRFEGDEGFLARMAELGIGV